VQGRRKPVQRAKKLGLSCKKTLQDCEKGLRWCKQIH
jgi:hypothetical protein